MTRGIAVTPEANRECKLHCKRIRAHTDLAALSAVFARLRLASILGGSPAKGGADGFSYWAAEPREVFQFRRGEDDPFAKLEQILARYRPSARPAIHASGREQPPDGMFRGGWIGYFGYELGRSIERVPQTTADDLGMPVIRLCFHDRLIAYDHHADRFWAVALQLPDDAPAPEEKISWLEDRLAQSREATVGVCPPADIERIDTAGMRCNLDKDDYLRAVRRIRRYIYDGEVYQVNFSQRFESDFSGPPAELFHWQNRYNPSGYGAYIDAGDFQIVSASPEMFITLDGDLIRTKPIKGTRARLEPCTPHNRQLNTTRFNELLTSEKEQAELNMIIDLERNDLARICRPGTRRVLLPRSIESHPTVFHAVATVGGKLRRDVSFTGVLKAMFPGGSITGAPKIRAMEIIDALEPTDRGVYTGSIGFVGLDGTVCLNIAIRTIIITAGKAFAQAGGGIVADSDPQAEWDETLIKARALLAGIRAVQGKQAAGSVPPP